MGSHGRLVRYWSMAQCHANDGCHVGLCAKDMDGDTSGLPCRGHGYNYGSIMVLKPQNSLIIKGYNVPF